jgi:hypothetical protein
MVVAEPGKKDLGTVIVDTISDFGPPLVFGVIGLAFLADLYEKATGKQSTTVRALFFDDPNQLSQDEDRIINRVLTRLSTPESVGDTPVKQEGLKLPWSKPSLLTKEERQQLVKVFKAHVLVWRKQVEADPALEEDEFRALAVLNNELLDLGKAELQKMREGGAVGEGREGGAAA